jgi:hypothetical protein
MMRLPHPFKFAPYHEGPHRPPYFEGWYFKQASEAGAFSAIPGVFLGGDTDDTAFVQVIFGSPPESRFIRYPAEDFHYSVGRFEISVGNNFFSRERVTLDIGEIGLSAALSYTGHVPLATSPFSPSIMGPFAYLPAMQCNHGVISLTHRAHGTVDFGSHHLTFRDADGYIEKDWGREFPQSWVWIQGNHQDAGVMFSAASIPFAGSSFTGLICALLFGGRQYRFATYNRAKLVSLVVNGGRVEAELARGGYRLRICAHSDAMGTLMAPTPSGMTRQITESIAAVCEVTLEYRGQTIFHARFSHAGLEMLNPDGLMSRTQKKTSR